VWVRVCLRMCVRARARVCVCARACACVCARARLARAMPCPAHLTKFLLIQSRHHSQTSHCGLHPSEFQIGRNLRVLNWGCGVVGVTLYKQIWRWLMKTV
jgi:hypothetical protein